MLLPDAGSVEVFRAGEGVLENPAVHDSASSAAGEGAQPIRGYAINADADSVFDLPLGGVPLCCCTRMGLTSKRMGRTH